MKGSHTDVQGGGLVEQCGVRAYTRVVAHPQLGGMEVAQNRGQASHVVTVGVAQRDHVKPANAARPERLRDYILSNVELLRTLARAAAKTAAIHKERLAFGRDEEKRVALADIDGFNQKRIAGMLDGPWNDGDSSRQQERWPRRTS